MAVEYMHFFCVMGVLCVNVPRSLFTMNGQGISTLGPDSIDFAQESRRSSAAQRARARRLAHYACAESQTYRLQLRCYVCVCRAGADSMPFELLPRQRPPTQACLDDTSASQSDGGSVRVRVFEAQPLGPPLGPTGSSVPMHTGRSDSAHWQAALTAACTRALP